MWRIFPCEFWVIVVGFGAALIVALIGVGFAWRFGGREMKELREDAEDWKRETAWADAALIQERRAAAKKPKVTRWI